MKIKHVLPFIVFVFAWHFFSPRVHCGNDGYKMSLAHDGFITIDKKRIFILGTYHLPHGEAPYRTLAENGFNLVRTPLEQKALAEALQNNLFTWSGIGHLELSAASEKVEAFQERIRRWKNHPALLFWELEDEPAFTWRSAEPRVKPEALIFTYNLVKKEDPDHFVYLNHAPVNLVSTLQKYNPSADVLACDVYPVIPYGIRPSYALFDDGLQGDLLNTSMSQVGEYVDKLKRVSSNKPLLLILQGFAWEMLRKEGDRDSSMVLYPDYKQLRFMAYNAIIHGVNGLLFWGTSYTPPEAPFWKDLFKLTKELHKLHEVLSAPAVPNFITTEYNEMGHSVDAGVEILTKKVGDDFYLITANADRNPVKVTLGGLQEFMVMESTAEGQSTDVHNGSFTEIYEAFALKVFLLKK